MTSKPTTTEPRGNKAKAFTPLPLPRSMYQIFPPHPPDCRAAMYASITQHGIENATVWDDKGNLLDGWERESICAEKNITCPREVRHFESEADKYRFILAVNAHRRPSLNQKQKRAVVAAYLQGDPGVADNMLGEALGVSKNTVAKIRQRLEAARQIPKLKKTRGKDGKLRPVKYTKRIITNTPNEYQKAQEIVKDLPENCAGKTLDITTAKRRADRNRKKKKKASPPIIVPLSDDAIRLYHCRFQELERVAGIMPASANLFLTDIPYGKSFLPQVAELGELAQRLLKEGGLLVCLCGQYWLNKVMETLDRSLTYRWQDAFLWEGDGLPVHLGGWKCPHGRIISKWKPLLIYSKGDFTREGQWCDIHKIDGKEKEWHPWQQPVELFEQLVRNFTDPGDLVVDPCAGAFTAALPCFQWSRKFVGCDENAGCVKKGLERLEGARNSMTLGA